MICVIFREILGLLDGVRDRVVLLFEERSVTSPPVALKTASINDLCTLPRLASEFGIFCVNASSFSNVCRTEPVASLGVGVRCGCTDVNLPWPWLPGERTVGTAMVKRF
jgi:hypothetical protein